jgi:predicted transposase YdaD
MPQQIKQRIPEGIMRESPLIQHYIQQAETRGEARGEVRGETQAKQEAVLKLLRIRFDPVPESVTEKITSIQSIARLDSLFENAVTAQNLNEIDLENYDS